MHLSEGSGDRMGTILKIFFCVFTIKHQGERQRRRGKCSLPVEALTEDESFPGIKEAPSLIIPWWDASVPICHSRSAGCDTNGGQRIQGEGQSKLKCCPRMAVVKSKPQIFCILHNSSVTGLGMVKMGLGMSETMQQ